MERQVDRVEIAPEQYEAYRARHRALKLIEDGNPIGAWAVAEPFHADRAERSWTRPVKWLALFSAKLPVPDACDVVEMTHAGFEVRDAIRIEMALRRGDTLLALEWSYALSAKLLWWGSYFGFAAAEAAIWATDVTPEMMEEACEEMQANEIWTEGYSFLASPVVMASLKRVGVERPDALLDDLIDEIQSRLI